MIFDIADSFLKAEEVDERDEPAFSYI